MITGQPSFSICFFAFANIICNFLSNDSFIVNSPRLFQTFFACMCIFALSQSRVHFRWVYFSFFFLQISEIVTLKWGHASAKENVWEDGRHLSQRTKEQRLYDRGQHHVDSRLLRVHIAHKPMKVCMAQQIIWSKHSCKVRRYRILTRLPEKWTFFLLLRIARFYIILTVAQLNHMNYCFFIFAFKRCSE